MAKIQGIHTPLKPKNLLLNGAFDLWQRVGTATTTVNTATTSSTYTADRFKYQTSGTTVKNFSIVQNNSNFPTLAQSGFQSDASYQVSVLTGISTLAATDAIFPIYTHIEGYDYEKIHGKVVTFGFWFYASIAGNYSFGIASSAASRFYVTTFNVASANTWQFIPITLTLDTATGYNFTTGIGLQILIACLGGSSTVTSSLNTWQSGSFLIPSTATNYWTTGASFSVAQLSMVEGPLGFGATGFTRAGDSIASELSLCQRYFESFTVPNTFGPSNGSSYNVGIFWKATKRIVPTVTGSITTSGASPVFTGAGTGSVILSASGTSTGSFSVSGGAADADF